ncbi:MAG: beta strand repeat-containing protein, partial [Mucilaginibacter sp.]
MKTRLYKLVFFTFSVILFFAEGASAYTFDWKGTTSSAWNVSTNWTRSGAGGTSTYPGQSGAVDIVKIGVTAYASNQPILSASVSVASVEFGDNNGGAITLTINTGILLNVVGSVTQDHNNNSGGTTTTITGTGTAELDCASFTVGDATAPPTPSGSFLLGNLVSPTTNTTTVNCTLAVLTISGNLTLNSTSSASGTYNPTWFVFPTNSSVNNPVFKLTTGTLTVNNIITSNLGSGYINNNDGTNNIVSSATYQMDLGATTNALYLLGATPLTIGSGGSIDFSSGGTATASTVYYAATSGTQKVYNSSDAGVGTSPTIYPNLSFTGAGAKTVDGGTLTVGAAWSTAGGAVNLNTNNATVTVTGAWTNSTTVTQGTGNISVTGTLTNSVGGTLTLGGGSLTISGNYSNNGTYTQGIGSTVFNGSAQTLDDAGNGTMFNNVTFNGGSTDIINSGNFSVSSSGVLTMSGTTVLNANGHLTLKSAASGSATIAAIPATASITGSVKVQRYITGGSLTYRGYRLLSSPVYTSTDAHGNNDYSINYLLTSTFLTGTNGTAGGFSSNTKLNPTLYLYRENMTPSYSTFTNSNFRGIKDISASPNYTIDVDGSPYNILAGNGFLFFFRGDITTVSPYLTNTVPIASTFSISGTLNQGQVKVVDWFTPTLATLSYTAASPATVRGYNLVGNPYASSIDWENFQTATTTTGIYGASVGTSIYVLDPISKNYGAYTKGGGGVGTNNATNIIASGQGFFVVTSCSCAKLYFNEGAKTNTQVTSPNLLMGMPADYTSVQYLRLQLAKDSVNTDDMIIRFNESASRAYSPEVDALYKEGYGQVSLSSFSSDQMPLAISVQPLPKTSETIALNVNTSADGNYQLNMKNITGIPQLYDIWLMDAYKKDSLDMRHNNTYSFDVIKSDTNTYGSKRFSLVIRQNPAYAYRLLNFTASKINTPIN